MFLTDEKHHKTQFLTNFGIFRNSWLFSENFGYFLTHSYQIWLFWHKIRILQMILDYTDILNKSLGKLEIKNAVLVLQPTTLQQQLSIMCELFPLSIWNSFNVFFSNCITVTHGQCLEYYLLSTTLVSPRGNSLLFEEEKLKMMQRKSSNKRTDRQPSIFPQIQDAGPQEGLNF